MQSGDGGGKKKVGIKRYKNDVAQGAQRMLLTNKVLEHFAVLVEVRKKAKIIISQLPCDQKAAFKMSCYSLIKGFVKKKYYFRTTNQGRAVVSMEHKK